MGLRWEAGKLRGEIPSRGSLEQKCIPQASGRCAELTPCAPTEGLEGLENPHLTTCLIIGLSYPYRRREISDPSLPKSELKKNPGLRAMSAGSFTLKDEV